MDNGFVVLTGTTVQRKFRLICADETTTTGRFFTISGGINPVEKSQINTVPGRG